MPIAETARLDLRVVALNDAPFILRLLNDPDFIRFIGDRGVRTLDDARRQIEERYLAHFAIHGFGPYVVRWRESGDPIGFVTLIKRDWLEHADVGYAFLPEHRGRGLAEEATRALMNYARAALRLATLAAITAPGNVRSESLLARLGFRFDRLVKPPDEDWPLGLYILPDAPLHAPAAHEGRPNDQRKV